MLKLPFFIFLEILSINLMLLILLAVTTWICLTRYKLISSSHLPCRQHYNNHWSSVSDCAILNAKMNFPSFVFIRHPTPSPHTARLPNFQLLSAVWSTSHWWTFRCQPPECGLHDYFTMSLSLEWNLTLEMAWLILLWLIKIDFPPAEIIFCYIIFSFSIWSKQWTYRCGSWGHLGESCD